jgi:hypothetical protein
MPFAMEVRIVLGHNNPHEREITFKVYTPRNTAKSLRPFRYMMPNDSTASSQPIKKNTRKNERKMGVKLFKCVSLFLAPFSLVASWKSTMM